MTSIWHCVVITLLFVIANILSMYFILLLACPILSLNHVGSLLLQDIVLLGQNCD